MRCESCNVVIRPEFTHAIKKNQCPACGQDIMQQAKLASYLSLRSLLENNVKDIDAEQVASLIVANFELQQLFKEELQKTSEEGIMEVSEDEGDIEVEEEDPDAEFKKTQKKESKNILKKMRDEALAGALDDQGFDFDEGGVLMEEGAGMHEVVNREKQRQAQNAVASGSTPGPFSRTG